MSHALSAARTPAPTVPEQLLNLLAALGVEEAFGLIGGAIAPLCDALGRSALRVYQLRHEGGALFAAIEASLATGRPTAAFVTTGPGLMNALNGAIAARWEGAKVLLISGATTPAQRGRWAVQESSAATLPAGVYTAGPLFDYARLVEHPTELAAVARQLATGFARPQGFVAHLALPIALQRLPAAPLPEVSVRTTVTLPSADVLADAAAALDAGPFVIWVGYGARHAVEAILRLAEHTGAPVVCTPRAKGTFPESHPLFLGVTGCGGHDNVEPTLAALGVRRALVLGTRLGEFSSCWSPGLAPPDGFVHVDVDPTTFGAAYPDTPVLGVVADVGAAVEALLARGLRPGADRLPWRPPVSALPARPGLVRPRALFAAVQAHVVEESDALVMAESGNSFVWANHELRFDTPRRYRASGLWGSMGQATSGVVGAALVHGKSVALVGDGAMLMMNEVSSAVQYKAPAVWIVLNDAHMGIVDHAMALLELHAFASPLPPTDFALYARALGADGEVVTDELELPAALHRALAAPGPYVVDVRIDPDEQSPFARRVSTLLAMSANGVGSAS